MACDAGHSYCFPRCAPRGGARPRCAGGAGWRLDPQTGLCFRLPAKAAEAAIAAAAKQTEELEIRARAWTDDPLAPGEVTRTPPSCPKGASPFPAVPAGLLAAGAQAAAPDPKLCLWCAPGDTLDVSGNRPRCLKPCPAGYDAVVLGGGGQGQQLPGGQRQGSAFCVQRCRPQDGYPYGRYCVAYGGFDYPGDCGWMAYCEEGKALLQHGTGGVDDNGGGQGVAAAVAAARANGRSSPPFSHMWAADGVNDEVVGLSDGHGKPDPEYPYGAAARAADRALLRQQQQQRRPGSASSSSPSSPPSSSSSSALNPVAPGDPLAPYFDQFDRQYARSPLYDPSAACRCATLRSERDARPRVAYLPLVRLPEPEVQTAAPRCDEASENAGSGGGGGECAYDRARGACVCGCPEGWAPAGSDGTVCCDPSCPEGFGACEAGGRRFCATSKPLLGADACAVLSRLQPFLSPLAVCGAPAPPSGTGADEATTGFSARAVGSVVSSAPVVEGDDAGKLSAAQAGDYPGALFGGVSSLPDVFSDEGRAAIAAAAGRGGGPAGAAASAGDDLSKSLLAQALQRQYEAASSAPPPAMTVQQVLSMDPWAGDFAESRGATEDANKGKPDGAAAAAAKGGPAAAVTTAEKKKGAKEDAPASVGKAA